MSELDLGDTFEEQWGAIKSSVRQHHKSLYGNGQPGVVDFVIGVKAQFRLILILVSVFGVLTAVPAMIITILEFNRQSQQHMLHLPHLFSEKDPALARDMHNQSITNE